MRAAQPVARPVCRVCTSLGARGAAAWAELVARRTRGGGGRAHGRRGAVQVCDREARADRIGMERVLVAVLDGLRRVPAPYAP
jgi:hypothetical protein